MEYLITQMLKGEKIYIGAPDSVRDYMYVDDHVNAYMLAVKNDRSNGQIYNAGTGIGISNRELAGLVAKKVGYDVENIEFGSYPPGYPFRPSISDQPYIVLDATKINKELNWSPKFPLKEGTDKSISYFKERLAKEKS
jgi:nucleoside-diphosphate-sugar epimerase